MLRIQQEKDQILKKGSNFVVCQQRGRIWSHQKSVTWRKNRNRRKSIEVERGRRELGELTDPEQESKSEEWEWEWWLWQLRERKVEVVNSGWIAAQTQSSHQFRDCLDYINNSMTVMPLPRLDFFCPFIFRHEFYFINRA